MNGLNRLLGCKSIVVSALLFAAQSLDPMKAAAATPPAKQVVGYATHVARVLPLWLAGEQNFFLKHGIDIDPVFIRGAPTLVAGLAAGSIQLGRTGGAATLGAVSAGHDFKIVATFSSRNTYDLVVRPSIKRAEDLRGKTFAVTSIGGTSWMGVLLWLEHLGLDQQRDNIRFQVIGDQAVQVQCVENGLCDAAAVDGVFTKQLKQKGMIVLGEYTELKAPLVSQAVVVPGALLQQRPETAENYLKGEIEALAFSVAPKNKAVVIKSLMRNLKVNEASAEDAYVDLIRGVDRKPFASLEGLRTVQRLLKMRNPKVGEVKSEEIIDNRIMRKLDKTGFIDGAYAAYGSLK
jgi:ABC-type nitrate/sulfonate/bicarbonate transport system substrate-binding protein